MWDKERIFFFFCSLLVILLSLCIRNGDWDNSFNGNNSVAHLISLSLSLHVQPCAAAASIIWRRSIQTCDMIYVKVTRVLIQTWDLYVKLPSDYRKNRGFVACLELRIIELRWLFKVLLIRFQFCGLKTIDLWAKVAERIGKVKAEWYC